MIIKGDNKTPVQVRNANFLRNTSKYLQPMTAKSFEENTTLSWELPKARFLSRILLLVRGTFTATHASDTTYTKSVFDKYNIFRRVRLSINNGFSPYDVSGAQLSLYNMTNKITKPASDNFGIDALGNTVSSGGTSNNISFVMELPITLNERDPIGQMLLQNEQSIVSLNLDTTTLESIMTETDITLTNKSITITPLLETFSIPKNPNAIPDFSVLKLVSEQSQLLTSNTEMIVKLPTNLTYRKMLIYLATDTANTAMAHAKISEFQLVFNTADTPIRIPADAVAYENSRLYNGALPVGAYALDFSAQGLANLGGSRDYIDTERLTEFWLKIVFTGLSGSTNYVFVTSENLAKLA